MRTNGKHEVIAQIAGPGLVLAALLVLVLSTPGIGRAQSSTASATPAATPAQAPAKASASSVAKPPEKGHHEGITVHGHWTIEVHNPDGKLVSHTEFENALVQPGGAQTLSSLLLGGAVVGGYEIYLGSDTTGLNGPCAPINTRLTSCILIGSLISPLPASFGDNSSGCGGTQWPNQVTTAGPCFPLSIATASLTGFAFSGTAVANTTVSITDVFLNPIICYSTGNYSPASSTISPNSCAQGWPEEMATVLTHATLPTQVTISAVGQLISVNVQLSFQ